VKAPPHTLSPQLLPAQSGTQHAPVTPSQTALAGQQSAPQVMRPAGHTQLPFEHVLSVSGVQLPPHFPPQPSLSPQCDDGVQVFWHTQVPFWHWNPGWQVPLHFPPQPSSAPHTAFTGQLGLQTHSLLTQVSFVLHAGSQSQVGMHVPLEQTNVGAQVLLKQRFVVHTPCPPTTVQNSSASHTTPSQGPSGRQERWHAVPAGQSAPHSLMSTHSPPVQNWPAPHTLFRHALGEKQPATQFPLTQVSFVPQVFPLHGSLSGTHSIEHA
jgi:hypothetical protein